MQKEIKGEGIPFDPIDPEKDLPQEKIETPEVSKIKTKDKKVNTNIIMILLLIFVVFSVSLAIALYVAKENEVNKRLDVEATLKTTQMRKAQVEKELEDMLTLKRQLEDELNQKKESYEMLLIQCKEQQSENEKLTEKLSEKIQSIASLKSNLDKQEKDNSIIAGKLEKLSRETEDIRAQLTMIRMAKEELEKKIIQLSRKKKVEAVELDTIVVDKGAADGQPVSGQTGNKPDFIPLGPPARIEGQVLVVNKEFAFVVINVGEKDGIKDSEVLEVYRGTEFLGKVQVERIYDTMSSAVILPEATKQEIKEGDIVKLI